MLYIILHYIITCIIPNLIKLLKLDEEEMIWSHFTLDVFNYHVLTKEIINNVQCTLFMYCKTLVLLLRRDTAKVRDRCSGMVRFKDGLRCKQ